jgi:hypothetical protein
MKEAPGSSETSVLTRATRRNNPEDTILHAAIVILVKNLASENVISKRQRFGNWISFHHQVRGR